MQGPQNPPAMQDPQNSLDRAQDDLKGVIDTLVTWIDPTAPVNHRMRLSDSLVNAVSGLAVEIAVESVRVAALEERKRTASQIADLSNQLKVERTWRYALCAAFGILTILWMVSHTI